ncbi:MAG: YhcB family protein [Actinobacteria bacterium]|nr:YhcB family protein [Actinomycetota bacterium]
MSVLAVSSGIAILAIIGLVVGLIVFFVVIFLLQSTLTPLTKTLASVKLAQTAPMLERGVPGTDQLGQTRRLAESVPPLALAYLSKLSLGGRPSPAPAQPTYSPAPTPAAAPPPSGQPDSSNLPAWQRYR